MFYDYLIDFLHNVSHSLFFYLFHDNIYDVELYLYKENLQNNVLLLMKDFEIFLIFDVYDMSD